MDYKKRFNDILDWARSAINAGTDGMLKEDLLHLMPELNESEDERIRKELIQFLTSIKDISESGRTTWAVRNEDAEMCNGFLAYLEKQKEQKPNIEIIQKSWYVEGYHDGNYNNEPKWLIQTGKGGPRYEENPKYGTQKPAEWSEEDKEMKLKILKYLSTRCSVIEFEEVENWLNNLSIRSHWKPSEEQINALLWVIENANKSVDVNIQLNSLYNDLKKL